MAKSRAVARLLEDGQLECAVTTKQGESFTVSGFITDLEPTISGDAKDLWDNRALITNAWAFAKHTRLSIMLSTDEEQQYARKRAQRYRADVEWIADLASDLSDIERTAWCSGCFGQHDHRRVDRRSARLPIYICVDCGSPTQPCAAPGCENMAVAARRSVGVLKACAEHSHAIPSFEKANTTIASLDEYESFREYEKANIVRGAKIAGAAIAVVPLVAGAAFYAAPAIGGAIGSYAGLSGAAALNKGLALLGGGTLASGGLGMAGGTMMVTATGGALGSVLGARIANAYVRQDQSFRVEKLRDGDGGMPVLLCNGFLTEGEDGWGGWEDMVTARYPDSPVYRIHWGAQELSDFGQMIGEGAVKSGLGFVARTVATRATQVGAKRLNPVVPAFVAADLVKNPWHVAKSRADKTGVVIADMIARTEADSYVLVGHSLGARALVVAIQTLSSKPDGPRIHTAHLMGAAIGAESDWHALTDRVENAVYNYHSTNDRVLKFIYRIAQGGQTAAGLRGFTPTVDRLYNLDASHLVDGHSGYFGSVALY